jgi:hypothetical protein
MMGRGLSDLQKRILMLTYERRQERDFDEERRKWEEMAEGNPYMRGMSYWIRYDLKYVDLLAELYDWPNKWGRRPSEHSEMQKNSEYRFRGQNFDRRRVGEAEYNRRTTSLYRAVDRLKRRGLLQRRGAGLWITDEGVRVAEGLSVTTGQTSIHS